MTALSVNINKVATLRNARGGTMPNLLEVTKESQRSGSQGITVHPRPSQSHIRYEDCRSLPVILTTEFTVDGNPIPKLLHLLMNVKHTQVTLLPAAVHAFTLTAVWDTIKNQDFLKEIIKKFQSEGIRTSIFIDPVLDQIEGAAATGTDRIELYTEAYAADYTRNREIAIAPYVAASERANELGLGINAGHDLNLDNIAYFAKRIPSLLEVSIGHALICESLYLGFENVIPMYLQRLSY